MPARKRTPLIASDAPPEALLARQAVSDPNNLEDDVERILGELGEGASSVSIWRESDTRPGNFDLMGRLPAGEFSVDWIVSQYGGGYYKIIISDATQGPLNPVFLSVDRRLIGKAFSVANPAQAARGNEEGLRDRLLDVLLAKTLQAPPTPPAPSHTNEILAVVTALIPPVLTALTSRGGNDGGNSVEMFAAMMNAATEMAKLSSPPEGFAAVAGQLIPVVDKLVAAQAASAVRRPVALPPARPLIVQTPTVPVSTPPIVPTQPVAEPASVAGSIVPKWLAPFRQFAGILVSLADADADPELYANVCVDQLLANEDAFKSAVEAMNAGTLKEDILSAVPALKESAQRIAFVESMLNTIESALKEELANVDEPSAEDAG